MIKEPEPIFSPEYWKQRLETAKELHHSIFRCPLEQWLRIEDKHRQILAATIKEYDSVFDAGCGYGRLLTLLPETWKGKYVGVDISEDFIDLARKNNRGTRFHPYLMEGDLQCLNWLKPNSFDWAVLISMRPMIKRNKGDEVWSNIEKELRRVARRLLYLEYDEADNGSIE